MPIIIIIGEDGNLEWDLKCKNFKTVKEITV